jgi:hypothetical protein
MPAVLLLSISVILLCATSPAWSDEPAGIVIEISGESSPALSGMSEIPANTTIQLKPDTKLSFLHYARCRLVAVTGGTLTLTRADYHEEGKIDSEADGPCPKIYSLDTGGEVHGTAGFLSRGPPATRLWPVYPDIIFTGARAAAVAAVEILADGQPNHPPLRLALTGLRAREPREKSPLQPAGHYILRVTMRDRPQPVDIPFITAGTSGADALVVLRFD